MVSVVSRGLKFLFSPFQKQEEEAADNIGQAEEISSGRPEKRKRPLAPPNFDAVEDDLLICDEGSPIKKTTISLAKPRKEFTAKKQANTLKIGKAAPYIARKLVSSKTDIPDLVIKKPSRGKQRHCRRLEPRRKKAEIVRDNLQNELLNQYRLLRAATDQPLIAQRRNYLQSEDRARSLSGSRLAGQTSFERTDWGAVVKNIRLRPSSSASTLRSDAKDRQNSTQQLHSPIVRPVHHLVSSTPLMGSSSSTLPPQQHARFGSPTANVSRFLESPLVVEASPIRVSRSHASTPLQTPVQNVKTSNPTSIRSPALAKLTSAVLRSRKDAVTSSPAHTTVTKNQESTSSAQISSSTPRIGSSHDAIDEGDIVLATEHLEITDPRWLARWKAKVDPDSRALRDAIREQHEIEERNKVEQEEKKRIEELKKQLEKQEAPPVVIQKGLEELSPEAEKKINECWNESLSENEIISKLKKDTLTIDRRDLVTLKGLNWLNDNVINGYLSLLVSRGAGESYPTCWAASTFFYPKLKKEGYKSVRRWTKKSVCPGGIFSKDIVIIPVHLKMHWACGFLDMRTKTIELYDSLGISEDCFFQVMRDYIVEEAKDKGVEGVDISAWTDFRGSDCPKQNNGCDCGVFAIKFADYRSRDCDIDFSQEHMQYFRRRTVYEICNGECL